MNNNLTTISNKRVACSGATLIVASVFAYSLLIMIYVIIRSSITIYSIMPRENSVSILWNNGISVAYSMAVFSIIMAIVSAIVGSIYALILKNALLYFNPKFKNEIAILISFITGFIIIMIIYILLFALLKDWMTINYLEPFLFWFVFPAIIFLMVCVLSGKKLNRVLLNINDNNINKV